MVQYQWFNDKVWANRMPEFVNGVLGRNCAMLRPVLLNAGGFEEPVRTGTDYALSRRLVRKGYPILGVPESRVETEYPSTARGYLKMWRRWNKNLLVHGFRSGAWKDITGVALSAMVTLAILLSPLAGPFALSIAAILVFTASLNRYRRVATGAQLAGVPLSIRLKVTLPALAILDLLAAMLAVYDSTHPTRRFEW
jgi:cellulose synthase/poly-beta-1,6-N-acetylglucosamine synthase-like glycosyltransferase